MSVEDASAKLASGATPSQGEAVSREAPRVRPWAAFAFRDFRMLWLSGVAAMVTMQMRTLSTGVWLYEETGSGLQLGLLGLIQFAVSLPAILYGGTLADQLDRKKLIFITQGFNFGLTAVLAVLAFSDSLRPWHIYGVTAVLGVASVIGGPARSAMLANTVPKSHLMHAVTTNTATFQVGGILAPLAFAGAVQAFGISTTFAITAAAGIPAALFPLLIKAQATFQPSAGKTSVLLRTWEGFLYVKSHPILPGLYMMDIGVTVVSFYRMILPLLADKLFGGGEATVGLLASANSFGGVAGTFAVLFLARYRPKGMLVIYATLSYALLLIAFGFSGTLWLGAIIIVGLGMTDAITMTTRHTTAQLTTPDEMMGRAMSFQSLSAMSANNLGTLEVGLMSDLIGAQRTMVLGGIISLAVVLATWRLVRGIREYRYP
jgi:MFS family permease